VVKKVLELTGAANYSRSTGEELIRVAARAGTERFSTTDGRHAEVVGLQVR